MTTSDVAQTAPACPLHIITDTQASADDVAAVREAFCEHFRVSTERTVPRFPGGVLPMIVSFTIDDRPDDEYYAALKVSILKLLQFGPCRISRRFYVQASHRRGTVYVSQDHIQIRWQAGFSEYSTLDDLFRELRRPS